ncbi:hypothetical protein ACIBSV_44125 [Embleya sp. NPDC050154]|uniref:hypothetical protein n=1 Tax=unclassified Embleya TaxID=2699296 RepID=UPI00379B61AB
MAQVAAGGAPARHGVFRVIVLIALMALLHATHVPGVGPRAAPIPDRCSVETADRIAFSLVGDVPAAASGGAPDEHDGHSARDAAPAGDTGGRHGPAVGGACTPATARPRHHVPAASAPALTDVLGSRIADPAEIGEGCARTATNTLGRTPSRTVVLRC